MITWLRGSPPMVPVLPVCLISHASQQVAAPACNERLQRTVAGPTAAMPRAVSSKLVPRASCDAAKLGPSAAPAIGLLVSQAGTPCIARTDPSLRY